MRFLEPVSEPGGADIVLSCVDTNMLEQTLKIYSFSFNINSLLVLFQFASIFSDILYEPVPQCRGLTFAKVLSMKTKLLEDLQCKREMKLVTKSLPNRFYCH